jgi:lipid II:glycine glycyltransferase (peptidoglycan interpeptide bridge formation enzyme)
MYRILEIKKDNGIQAAWPIVGLKSEEPKHVYMPALTQKLGILFAPSNGKLVERQSSNQFLTNKLLEQLGTTVSFHQNFHENFTDWLPFYWQGFTQTTRYTYVLEDLSDVNVLWNNMRQECRTEIRKAKKLGIQIKDDLDLGQFLNLNRKTFARQGKEPLAGEELVYRLDQACVSNAGRKIFAGVDAQGRVHAAVYVAWSGDTAYALMGGSDPELRQSGAYKLAFWEAVLFASSIVRRFDFMGSMLPQVELGLRIFGPRQLPYFSISKVPPPPKSLGGFLKMAVKFRLDRVHKKLTDRFQK